MDGDWSALDLPLFVKLVLLNRPASPPGHGPHQGPEPGERPLAPASRQHPARQPPQHPLPLRPLQRLLLALPRPDDDLLGPVRPRGQPLAEAQHNKFRSLAEKVHLGPRDHVLEIGCGWGGFAIFAARTYGCRVTRNDPLEQQYRMARERVAPPAEDNVAIRLLDYRDLEGRFDKIVSIETFEARARRTGRRSSGSVRRSSHRGVRSRSRPSPSRIIASTNTPNTATGSRSGSSREASWPRPWGSAAPWPGRVPSESTISRTSASTMRSRSGAGAKPRPPGRGVRPGLRRALHPHVGLLPLHVRSRVRDTHPREPSAGSEPGPEPGPSRHPGSRREGGMRSFLRRHLTGPLLLLLKQGLAPEALALSLALGPPWASSPCSD